MRSRVAIAGLVACLLLVLGACASRHMAQGRHSPPEYAAGYADGCATATARTNGQIGGDTRDATLFKMSHDYRTGWSGGYASCRVNNPSNPLDNPFGKPPGT